MIINTIESFLYIYNDFETPQEQQLCLKVIRYFVAYKVPLYMLLKEWRII